MTNHAEQQARAQLQSIVDMVHAIECDFDRLDELRDERDSADDAATWEAENVDGANELRDLEDAAGDCADLDEAQQRIYEDPLSIEVRSGWQSMGEKLEPEEFCILLCTGGPAVRIVGDIEGGCASRPRLQFQDLGTPWTELVTMTSEGRRCLAVYCEQFTFDA